MTELKWGIIGTGGISQDFGTAMKKCEHPNKVGLKFKKNWPSKDLGPFTENP